MKRFDQRPVADLVSTVPWGTHSCHFYHSQNDLLDLLVPYFKKGLLNNEYCIWVTSRRADIKDALARMKRELPRFDAYLDNGQIDILPASEWYIEAGMFNGRRVLTGWIDKCNQATARGYRGMRLTGDTLWLKKSSWKSFADYEEELDKTMRQYPMAAICTYSLDKCRAFEVIDVVKNHGFALVKRGEWERIENAQRRRAEEEAREKVLAELERRVEQRTAELREANRKLMAEIEEHNRAEESLRASREQLRALAAYLQSVREEERTHIARELHDEIGQALTAIKFALERNARDPSSGNEVNLSQAAALANELIRRVRDLSLELRPAMLDDIGLLAALRWHFDRYTEQFNIAVEFKQSGLEGRRLAPEIETAAYRIVQEALTNVARYAKVDKVEVHARVDENLLQIHVRDSGSGFKVDAESPSRTGGLSGMRERAFTLAGRLSIESAPGAGTLVLAELPLRPLGAAAVRRAAGSRAAKSRRPS